jgi:hypothetical protein
MADRSYLGIEDRQWIAAGTTSMDLTIIQFLFEPLELVDRFAMLLHRHEFEVWWQTKLRDKH